MRKNGHSARQQAARDASHNSCASFSAAITEQAMQPTNMTLSCATLTTSGSNEKRKKSYDSRIPTDANIQWAMRPDRGDWIDWLNNFHVISFGSGQNQNRVLSILATD